jgi:hypothetical protein
MGMDHHRSRNRSRGEDDGRDERYYHTQHPSQQNAGIVRYSNNNSGYHRRDDEIDHKRPIYMTNNHTIRHRSRDIEIEKIIWFI